MVCPSVLDGNNATEDIMAIEQSPIIVTKNGIGVKPCASDLNESDQLDKKKEKKIFILRKDNLELIMSIDEADNIRAESLKEGFKRHIQSLIPDHTSILSQTDLLLAWADYLSMQVPPPKDLLECSFNELNNILQGRNPHFLQNTLQSIQLKKALYIYYNSSQIIGKSVDVKKPAIFSHGNQVKLSAVFGGQGNTHDHLGEVKELVDAYEPMIGEFLDAFSETLLKISKEYIEPPMDVMKWLSGQHPDEEYLNRSSVSLSLVGVVQLLNYCILLKSANYTPEELMRRFTNATGHSQGIVSAVVFVCSRTFNDILKYGCRALKFLFLVGYRAEQIFGKFSSNLISSSEYLNGIVPTPMLAISNLFESDLQAIIKETSNIVSTLGGEGDCGIEISLVNSPKSFVCSGPTRSLQALYTAIEEMKAKADEDQSRIPFSQRRKTIHTRFLPISTPFHHSSLRSIIEPLQKEVLLNDASFQGINLEIPLVCPHRGATIIGEPSNLDKYLIESICTQKVDWMLATSASFHPKITHFVDFGPGGLLGIGVLTHRVREGSGIKVILGSTNAMPPSGLQNRVHLLDDTNVTFGINWGDLYRPKVVKKSGKLYVETKLSKLLNKPPLMVAGMTPTTVNADINVAIAKAGYHIELAGGGHYTEFMLEQKIDQIVQNIPSASGVTLNVLFLNPRLWNQQFPLAVKLRQNGVPVEGFTVAAGVPSLPIANDVIAALKEAGLKHVSFKPGSIKAIMEVLAIAKANPTYPIILQWTSGRGGGHHSYEDFHQPILDSYAALRTAPNLILVAGSGFGDGKDSLPYLTGEWSIAHGYPPMPFDGILLASRMLVCEESKLSLEAKELLVQTEGIKMERDWEISYSKPAGGIVTVMSELGEPIHKVATRSVLFWKELDETIFSLPREKRLAALQARKGDIIRRLNRDHQKLWFPQKSNGLAVDEVSLMTYGEVLIRLVELCFVKHQNRWIDHSYKGLVYNFAHRMEQRFCRASTYVWQSGTFPETPQDPFEVCNQFLGRYPLAQEELVSLEDQNYFVHICSNFAMKPVPFIPLMDENFEQWFKRDSLWGAEDLDAIPNCDVQRVCILQGPVAVKYSQQVNEPASKILDDINQFYIEHLPEQESEDDPEGWIKDFVSKEFVCDSKSHKVVKNAFCGFRYSKICNDRYNVYNGKDKALVVLKEKTIEVQIDENFKLNYHYDPWGTISTILYEHDYVAISDFYWHVWFPQSNQQELNRLRETEPWELKITTTSLVNVESVEAFCQIVRNHRYMNKSYVPMDYVIVIAWPTVTKLLFAKGISTDNNLLSLVHMSNKYISLGPRMHIGQAIESEGRITLYEDTTYGRIVQVEAVAHDLKTKTPVMRIVSQFLFRESSAKPVSFSLKDNVIIDEESFDKLKEQKWFKIEDDLKEEGCELKASILSVARQNAPCDILGEVKGIYGQTERILGTFAYQGSINEIEQLMGSKKSNVRETIFEHELDLSQVNIVSLSENAKYSEISGDRNPIHTEGIFAKLANLPQIITHGMWTSAAIKGAAEAKLLPNLKGEFFADEEVAEWQVDFTDIVRPGDNIQVSFQKNGVREGMRIISGTGMVQERQVVKITALLKSIQTAYVFTGQGSQVSGMGMDLYDKSIVARHVWDKADIHFRTNYGFSILEIVRNNPFELTIHFGGRMGPKIRENYRSLMIETDSSDSKEKILEPLFPEIHEDTESYTFRSPAGLLNATQFTQPALVLFEKAAYEDLLDRGLISKQVQFAGHSLGEYAALASIGDVINDKDLCDIVFYRGLTMQKAVPRDPITNRSGFGMIAINPSRVHSNFDAYSLEFVIDAIKKKAFLEIANYNVEGQQYVIAGRVEALECLTQLMNFLYVQKIDIKTLRAKLSEPDIRAKLDEIIVGVWKEKCEDVSEVTKGIASIPLPGIDVPFHSSFLLPGVAAFRAILFKKLKVQDIHVHRMNGKYIPNLIGEPFQLDTAFLAKVYDRSQSVIIKKIMDEWEEPNNMQEAKILGHKILVELLAYQFASPVQWIKTQQTFFETMDVQKMIEIGPAPILAGMAERTLKRYAKSDSIMGRKRLIQSYQRDNSDIYYRTVDKSPVPEIPTKNDTKTNTVIKEQIHEIQEVPSKPSMAVPAIKQNWDKLPFSSLNSLQVILGYKLKKLDIPPSKSIKELSMGRSTVQNELFGDLLREFGDGKTPDNKAEELSLTELAKEIDSKLEPSFNLPGKQILTYVNKMASSKFTNLSQLEGKLASMFGIQSGQASHAILAYGLLFEPSQRVFDDEKVNEWLRQVVEHFGSIMNISLIPTSNGPADQINTVMISSEEIKQMEKKQLEFFRRQLELLADHTGDTGRDMLLALQGKIKEIEELKMELNLWNIEYTSEHLSLIKPQFRPKYVRTFSSYWNWAKENVVRKILNGAGNVDQIIGCAEDGTLPELVKFMVNRIADHQLNVEALEDSIMYTPMINGPPLHGIPKRVFICHPDYKVSPKLTRNYRQTLRNDVSFQGKVVLITGAGPRSIGSELVAYLLRGGAHAIVTTSSFAKNIGYFEQIYRNNCSKGSVLQVIPFNAASQTDCLALINFIHDVLKRELDYFIPFAAINEVGRDISRLDAISEAAHRAMLINIERMLGLVVDHKRLLRLDTRPVTVLLPLSPNQGNFGGDGLYGESKAALKALLNKWHSERSWAPYVQLIGCIIGWTKGTGLMAENDLLAEYLVRHCKIQTFSSSQMAWLCACLLKQPFGPPSLADLTGGMGKMISRFPELMDKAKSDLAATYLARKTPSLPVKLDLKAHLDLGFLLWYTKHELRESKENIHMSWLDQTVVITGYGEVSPWGNARTRWAVESRVRAGRSILIGLLPLETIIELAWIMGLIQLQKDGWHDAASGKPIADQDILETYEATIIANCGIRKITPIDAQGYDPEKKPLAQEIVLSHQLGPLEVTKEEAESFARFHPAQYIEVKQISPDKYSVKLLPGATLLVPKAAHFDRLVAGLIPRGWNAERLGLSPELARQVDPCTAYTLAAVSEALVCSGITDPYELYQHVHVSDVGNTIGGGNGGMASNRLIFTQRYRDQQIANDISQESFINTMPAWVNMLLMSSSGPIRTAVGACATALASLDNAVDLLQQRKAKIVLCGGNDDFGEQGSYEFAQMGATSNSLEEEAQGRLPWEHCRPAADTRGGFLESHGAGVQVLMTARTALELGVPIYAVVAASHTASDGASRSVPAPGQGILSGADRILQGLRDWKLDAEDLDIASFHGTGTKANDWNECQVLKTQLKHWGRKSGKAVAAIFQKYLTGHPKAPAAAWMINGAVQALNSGILPGHGTLDNVDPALKEFSDYFWIPSEPHDFNKPNCSGLRTALIKSFGFGQVGGEVLLVRGDFLLNSLDKCTKAAYMAKLKNREQLSKLYWQQCMMHEAPSVNQGLIRIKNGPPYPKEQAAQVYLNHKIRIDSEKKVVIPNIIEEKEQLLNILDSKDKGVGLDIQNIGDFPYDNDNFIADNFTDREVEQLNKKPDIRSSFAGRWAAKEAVFKVLCSNSSSDIKDKRFLKWIEILNDQNKNGAPTCISHPHIQVSISHSGNYAVAMARL